MHSFLHFVELSTEVILSSWIALFESKKIYRMVWQEVVLKILKKVRWLSYLPAKMPIYQTAMRAS